MSGEVLRVSWARETLAHALFWSGGSSVLMDPWLPSNRNPQTMHKDPSCPQVSAPSLRTVQGSQNACARERFPSACADGTHENGTGGGSRGFRGDPVGYAVPREGEPAAATLLRLPAGNEEGDLLREFVVEGNKQ